MKLNVIVMAAGQGKRMNSARPKVLMPLAGRALLSHVLGSLEQLPQWDSRLVLERVIVITGHGVEAVEAVARTHALPLHFVRQAQQLGTGHAVAQALPHLRAGALAIVLNGDVPLIAAKTIAALATASAGKHLTLLTAELPDPSGYGRILRQAGRVTGIIEQRDANAEQQRIREIYTGALAAPVDWLQHAVPQIGNQNAQGEFYLTDLAAIATADGMNIATAAPQEPDEIEGINDAAQLANLERHFQARQARALLALGVRLADPARLEIRGELICARDVEIDIGCVFTGRVVLGEGARIGAHCVLSDCTLDAGCEVFPLSHIEGATIGAGSRIGPFARLRPGAQLAPSVHIGNFVEVKNSRLGEGAKANHLAYLGDAEIGAGVNYGAGSITANYDGANKHATQIGAQAHIGSNSVLVAPVSIGAGATIGAGSVITKDVEPNALALTRAEQRGKSGWKRPAKKI